MQFLTEPILVQDLKSQEYCNSKGVKKRWYAFTHKTEFENGDIITQLEFISEKIYNKLESGKYFCFYGNCYMKDKQSVWYLTDCELRK